MADLPFAAVPFGAFLSRDGLLALHSIDTGQPLGSERYYHEHPRIGEPSVPVEGAQSLASEHTPPQSQVLCKSRRSSDKPDRAFPLWSESTLVLPSSPTQHARHLQKCLQVKPHDFFDAARCAASILGELGYVEITALTIELERFERDVQAKLVPILPTIGGTFLWAVDANGSVVNSICLDAFTPRTARKPKRANRRIVKRGCSTRLGSATSTAYGT